MTEQLAAHFDVTVAFPGRNHGEHQIPSGLQARRLAWHRPSSVAGRLGPTPRLGEYLLGGARQGLYEVIADFQPDALYWTHSYLRAAVRPHIPATEFVEFANIEHLRSLSIARTTPLGAAKATAFAEYLKGRVWEPKVATSASACIALTRADERLLRRYTDNVVLAENGLAEVPYVPSPQNFTVGAIATWGYGPNRDGLEWMLATQWRHVIAKTPAARLLVGGIGAADIVQAAGWNGHPSVSCLGYVPDLDEFYQQCSVIVAPALSGGGQQLKVAEGLSYGRVVVGPPHVLASAPDGVPVDALQGSDDLGAVVSNLFLDKASRWSLEQEILDFAADHTWEKSMQPVLSMLRQLRPVDTNPGTGSAGR